jgi:hypothetical protein
MDIAKIIRKASQESIDEQTPEEYIENSVEDSLQDLYEDVENPTQDELIANEVCKSLITEPVKRKLVYDDDDDEEAKEHFNTHNPYLNHNHQSAEAQMQDRLLTIEGRPANAPWGSLWVTNSQFREQVALLNITKSEQRGLLREWADIEILSEGDGNEAIVESDQNELALKIISYKSRSDNPERGIRERTAHITQKSIQDQTVIMPKSEPKAGFMNQLLGRKVNNDGR